MSEFKFEVGQKFRILKPTAFDGIYGYSVGDVVEVIEGGRIGRISQKSTDYINQADINIKSVELVNDSSVDLKNLKRGDYVVNSLCRVIDKPHKLPL